MKNKKIFNIIIVLLMMVSLLNIHKTTVHAAGISVYASSSTASPGSSVNVTVSNLSQIRGRFDISVSNGSTSSSSFFASGGSSYSFRVTVGSSGTTYVNVSASDAATINGDAVSGGGTAINIKKASSSGGSSSNGGSSSGSSNMEGTPSEGTKDEETKNKNSALASLQVSTGTLSPAFKAGTTLYKVQLPATASSITISAQVADRKTSVRGTGEKSLKAGNNTFEVVCTAENDSYTTYVVNVYVDEKPLVYLKYNNTKLGVARNTSKAPALSKLFTKTSMKIDGQKVVAWNSKSLDITLLYMQSEAGNNYYMYDESTKELTSVYEPMGILGKNIARVDVPKTLQKRDGMTFTTIKVDGKSFPGWIFQDETMKDFALLYVMDDAGKYVYYQYEKSEDVLQLYSGAAVVSQEVHATTVKDLNDTKDTLSTYKLLTYVFGGVSVLLLITTIVLCLRRKNHSNKRYQKASYDHAHLKSAVDMEAQSLKNEEE